MRMLFSRGIVSRRLLSPPSKSVSASRRPLLGTVELDRWRDQEVSKSPSKTFFRCFHSTEKREIVPLIAVGTLFILGRYSYKALKRMDGEWEDYQWELQQYEKQKLRNNPQQQNNIRSVAVDLGSIQTKLALSYPQPEIIVTREGDRSFFNGVVYENGVPALRGRAALEKFYYASDDGPQCDVSLPYNTLNGDTVDKESAASIVSDVLSPALTEALERFDYKTEEQALRAIVTVPAQHVHSQLYTTAFSNIYSQQKHDTVLVPDPVAAIWGAQAKLVLPVDEADRQPHKTLVVDVGGLTTQLSVVSKDIVNYTLALPWGGETCIELMIEMLQKESPSHHPLNDARSLSALQVHARTAVGELATRSQASVHVPYLFPDPANHHLETKVSRSVLELAVNADIRNHLVDAIDGADVLSSVMPKPTDLTSLLTSVITQVLEQSRELPTSINHVMLIGGGSKMPMVKSSLSSALFNLMGTDASAKLVVPETALLTELTALGAATMLPTYDYTVDDGLQRVKDS